MVEHVISLTKGKRVDFFDKLLSIAVSSVPTHVFFKSKVTQINVRSYAWERAETHLTSPLNFDFVLSCKVIIEVFYML